MKFILVSMIFALMSHSFVIAEGIIIDGTFPSSFNSSLSQMVKGLDESKQKELLEAITKISLNISLNSNLEDVRSQEEALEKFQKEAGKILNGKSFQDIISMASKLQGNEQIEKAIADRQFEGFRQSNFSSKLIYKQSFSKKRKLPAKIIFIEKYFEQNNRIFFLNRDYTMSYSQIVEYDLGKRKYVKKIYSLKGKGQIILDYDCDNNNIVWSVFKRVNGGFLADIYQYNITSKKLTRIKENINCTRKDNKRLPLHLKVDNGKIVWLEYSINNEETYIKQFNIEEGLEYTVESINSMVVDKEAPLPTTFLELKNGKLFFDKKQTTGKVKIVLYDIVHNKIINEWNAKDDVTMHYAGAYSIENDYLALYAKTKKGDQIYIFDMANHKMDTIAVFPERTFVYDDKLKAYRDNVFYSVQQNVSGQVQDHYYSEIYDLKNKQQEQIKTAFDIFKNDKYLCVLKFDDVKHINKINFEMY